VTLGNDNGTDGQTDGQTDRQSATQYAAPPREEGRIKSAQRDANTARALAVVRFGHRPPVANTPTDRTDNNTLRR